jgi:alpha-D-xyloside xylohydrolase
LIPYLYSCAYVASQTGLPLMRPLVLEFQDDPAAHQVDSEYLLGEWLLIAPILTDRDHRTIYLPEGRWMDYWTHTVYSGPQYLQYEAALDTLPIFIRAGAILPLGPDMQYVGEKPFDPITLLLFPGPESSFVLQDDREKVAVSCQTSPGQLTLEVGPSSRSYYVQIVGIPQPVRVESGADEIPRLERLDGATRAWTWDSETGARIKCHTAPFKIVVHMAGS